MLGHDLLGALQDNTITEDTTTLCTEKPRKRSIKKKPTEENIDEVTQFGFENMVFEMDNTTTTNTSNKKEPKRYCSLAKFVDGSDIARKSFKVRLTFTITVLVLHNFFG